jgi:hypothetical protein
MEHARGDIGSRSVKNHRPNRLVVLASAALAAMVVMVVPTLASAAPTGLIHGLNQRGAPHSGTNSSNLVDHGGPVLSTSHPYVIWWGSPTTWTGNDIKTGMASFFSGLNGSSYVNTATQYMRGASLSVAASTSVADPSAPPKKVNPSTLGNEVQKEVTAQSLPLDPTGVYFVFTSSAPSGGSFCAWHSYAAVGGAIVSVVYMPNISNIAGCAVSGASHGYSPTTQSLANVSAHEFMEAITDPFVSAWYDTSHSEIGDKCAWQFGSSVTLANGSTWQLQEEWSNLAHGCVQTT